MNIIQMAYFAIPLLGMGFQCSLAQSTTATSGGNATGNGGFVSYTVGQTVYSANNGSNGSVLEGVQQPYEITIQTVVSETTGIDLALTAYPNPVKDNLILTVEIPNPVNLSFKVFDTNGKLLNYNQVTSNQTTIFFANYTSGVYFLKVLQNNNELKTFKIIKN